jgi:phospholipid transport system substrate-binding protein
MRRDVVTWCRATCAVWLAAIALGAGASAEATDGAATKPHEVIAVTRDALIAVIDEGKGYFDQDPERFYRAVRGVLDPVVDFDSFSRGVMAVYYRKATPEQRARFRDTFKDALVRTYGKALLNYGDERIDVLPPGKPSRQPDRESVTMEVWSEGKVYPVQYSMHLDSDGHWRMGNIIINGINIGLTYRNQFATAMKAPQNKGDIDLVITDWGKTIADVDPMADEAKKQEGKQNDGAQPGRGG